jgi:tetratricopeptide (TPR) repeat protein
MKPTSQKLVLLGVVYLALNRNEEAFITFTEGLTIATEKGVRAQINANLAVTALRLGKIEDAIDAAESAIAGSWSDSRQMQPVRGLPLKGGEAGPGGGGLSRGPGDGSGAYLFPSLACRSAVLSGEV